MLTSNTIQSLWKTHLHSVNTQDKMHAREELISHYRYLVRTTSLRIISHLPAQIERDDLISVGTVGLIKAIDNFDPMRFVKFETYAISLIRGAILEMLREEDWVPRSVREAAKRIERAMIQAQIQYCRSVTDSELATILNMDIDQVNSDKVKMSHTYVHSIDEVINNGQSDPQEILHVVDVLADEDCGVDVKVATRERDAELEKAVIKLSELKHKNGEPNLREYKVIVDYYVHGHTFKEIGADLKVSESRIYQLHGQAVSHLKKYLTRHQDLFVA